MKCLPKMDEDIMCKKILRNPYYRQKWMERRSEICEHFNCPDTTLITLLFILGMREQLQEFWIEFRKISTYEVFARNNC